MSINYGSKNTNCLTYIPNDIKLTLSNGTLTLKAGSKVYVPNGAGVFNEKVISKDFSGTNTTISGQYIVYYWTNGSIQFRKLDECFSGSTAPTSKTYELWYDTSVNQIKYSNNSGSSWERIGEISFPIAIVNFTSGTGVTSIDQVFNGFGYIGNTIYALPGVKGLIPNGINEDGTYKVVERIVDKVFTYTYQSTSIWTRSKNPLFIAKTGEQFSSTSSDNYFIGADRSKYNDRLYCTFYNTSENIMYHAYATAGDWSEVDWCHVGYASMELGKITSLTPNPVQSETTTRKISKVYFGTPNTNCLTHIPNDIKLELNNGTLTLKAGSKVYVPNGTTGQTETTVTETYECFRLNSMGTNYYHYVKAPYSVNDLLYIKGDGTSLATSVNELSVEEDSYIKSINSDGSIVVGIQGSTYTVTFPRYPSGDFTNTTTTIVPSGDKVFKEVVISSDNSVSGWSGTYQRIVCVKNGRLMPMLNHYSGATAPTVTGNAFWYDTANNIIKRTTDSGATWDSGYSLPIALISSTSSVITSIDQVFNGFGYIGGTLFALPGVKGLIPNGINEDGTYKNSAEWINDGVRITEELYVDANAFSVRNNTVVTNKYFGEYTTAPNVGGSHGMYYNTKENQLYVSGGAVWSIENCVVLGYMTHSGGKITSLTPNEVQPETTGRKINFIYKGSTMVYSDVPTTTFNASSSTQTYTVPNGATKLHVVCVASQGYGSNGGKGGFVECDLNVTGGETLYITVGGVPTQGHSYPEYNASDIRIGGTAYSNRVLVAGGGGNQANSGAVGGAGGGTTGGNGGKGYGADSMGKGGTQTAGGTGGAGTPVSTGHYHNGEQGTLGLGGAGSKETAYEGPSGAGGAGYYGGGGGAGDWNKNGGYTAGGGGGSSYANTSRCSNVKHSQGFRTGAGYITISLA